ncbi:MAG: OsmC family protein [Pseudomonadota bacterium]|nr:OsmC family protein [Pseudomonadota bacterium]
MATRRVPASISPSIPVGKVELDALVARGKADPGATRTLRCRTVARGRFSQLNYIRDLPPQPVTEDEPAGLLAEATAPNASEALLAAFGSCLAVGIHANAVARHIAIRTLELEVEADINTTAVWGAGDLHPKTIGFETVRVSVRLDADAPRETLEALIKHATLWSPVANTLHNPVHLDVMLEPAAAKKLEARPVTHA